MSLIFKCIWTGKKGGGMKTMLGYARKHLGMSRQEFRIYVKKQTGENISPLLKPRPSQRLRMLLLKHATKQGALEIAELRKSSRNYLEDVQDIIYRCQR